MALQRVARLRVVEGGGEQVNGMLEYREFLVSVDAASVATIVAANQNFAVTGIAVGDIPLYICAPEATTAGVSMTPMGPCVTVNVLVVRCTNPTAGAIDLGAFNYRVGVLRPPTPAI